MTPPNTGMLLAMLELQERMNRKIDPAWLTQGHAFLRAVRSGSVPAITGEEAVASLEIAMQCLAARPSIVTPAQRKGPRAVAG